MKTFLKIEIRRIFKSWGFWVSIAIGVVLSITQYIMIVIPMLKYIDTYKEVEFSTIMPHTVFSKWIGGEAISVQHFLLFMLLPIISVVPWGISTYNDRKNGIIKNYFIRAPKYQYLFSKYIINFIVGGIVSILPLVTNLVLTTATLPSIKPEVSTGTFAIRTDSMFAELFYSNPYGYIGIYILIIFAFCGIIACFSTSSGLWLDNSFTVLLLPFITHLFLYTFCSSVDLQKFAPFYFLDPFQSASSIKFEIIIFEAIFLIIISIISFIKGVKNETL